LVISVDELERLERQVEEDDSRLRKLEEEKNLSAHESSLLKAQQDEYLRQQRMSVDKMKEMERELAAKDELVSYTMSVFCEPSVSCTDCQYMHQGCHDTANAYCDILQYMTTVSQYVLQYIAMGYYY
jgi:hypothetical protein